MHSRRAFGSRLAHLATAISSKVIAWGHLMSPGKSWGVKYPGNYHHASKIDRVWDARKSPRFRKEPESELVHFGWNCSQSSHDIFHESLLKLHFRAEFGTSKGSPKYNQEYDPWSTKILCDLSPCWFAFSAYFHFTWNGQPAPCTGVAWPPCRPTKNNVLLPDQIMLVVFVACPIQRMMASLPPIEKFVK